MVLSVGLKLGCLVGHTLTEGWREGWRLGSVEVDGNLDEIELGPDETEGCQVG